MLIRILTKQFVKYIRRDLALQFLLQGRLGLHSALPTGLQAPLGIHFGVPAVLQAPLRLHFGLQTGLLSACSKALRKLLAYAGPTLLAVLGDFLGVLQSACNVVIGFLGTSWRAS